MPAPTSLGLCTVHALHLLTPSTTMTKQQRSNQPLFRLEGDICFVNACVVYIISPLYQGQMFDPVLTLLRLIVVMICV